MRIECSEIHDEAAYREMVNASVSYKELINNPGKKVKDRFRELKTYIAVCASLLLLLVIMGIMWGFETLSVAGITLMAVCIIISSYFLYHLNAFLKTIMEDKGQKVLIVDEDGIEVEKTGAQSVRLNWDNIAFMKVLKHTVVFIPKDQESRVMITAELKYRDPILNFMKENDIETKIIE